jgi:hypothetical protein
MAKSILGYVSLKIPAPQLTSPTNSPLSSFHPPSLASQVSQTQLAIIGADSATLNENGQVNDIAVDLTTKKKDLDAILEAYLGVHPRYALSKRRGLLEAKKGTIQRHQNPAFIYCPTPYLLLPMFCIVVWRACFE